MPDLVTNERTFTTSSNIIAPSGSPDGGDTWSAIEPNAEDSKQYYTIYNTAYYSNPLRGLKGYSYYGSTTGFTYAPDPQGWFKATFDITEFCGNNDVKIRIVTGWSTLSTGPSYFESFFRFDAIINLSIS